MESCSKSIFFKKIISKKSKCVEDYKIGLVMVIITNELNSLSFVQIIKVLECWVCGSVEVKNRYANIKSIVRKVEKNETVELFVKKCVTRYQRWIICYNENANLNATKSGKVNFKSTKQIVAYACDAYMFHWYVQTNQPKNKQTKKETKRFVSLLRHSFLSRHGYLYQQHFVMCARDKKLFQFAICS